MRFKKSNFVMIMLGIIFLLAFTALSSVFYSEAFIYVALTIVASFLGIFFIYPLAGSVSEFIEGEYGEDVVGGGGFGREDFKWRVSNGFKRFRDRVFYPRNNYGEDDRE